MSVNSKYNKFECIHTYACTYTSENKGVQCFVSWIHVVKGHLTVD